MLFTSSDGSRAVKGGTPHRPSIHLSTAEGSNGRLLKSGVPGDPTLKGEAMIAGTRKPSRDLPSTMSGSTPLGAAARGGATWSKKPPPSSHVMTTTVEGHAGPLWIAEKVWFSQSS